MPAVKRPPAKPAPKPVAVARPAPRPAAPKAAPRPAPAKVTPKPEAKAAGRPAPAHAATGTRTQAHPAAPAARRGGPAPAAKRPAGNEAKQKGKPAPKAKQKGKPKVTVKTPVAFDASAAKWYTVLASVYDANGGGGSCGNTSDGKYHYAELGVAGDYGHGPAHGEGNLARAFGRGGQLGCGFGLYVRYKGRTTFATKSDIGYGNTSIGPNAQGQRSIDLLRNLADWLHFDGVDSVEVAFHSSGTAPAPSTVEKVQHYFNPIEHARVTPERIDQGVDYAGTGYFVAIADGVVTESAPGGWGSFGNYIEYKITQPGQLEGAFVYYAEGVSSVVHKGEEVRGGSRICDLIPGWHSGTEIGFAAGDGSYHSYYAYHDGPYHEGDATRPGIAFSNLIASLGGTPGKIEGPEVGKWPEFVPNGDLTGVTNTLPGPSDSGGIQTTPTDAQNEANSVDWGESVKQKWHNLQNGSYTATHHSNSAKDFALGTTYIEKV